MPLKSINQSSAYERLFGQKPSLQHLKCYGWLCFVSTLSNNKTKLPSLVIHHIRRLTKSLILSPTKFIFPGMLCSMSNISHSINILQHLNLPNTSLHPSGIPDDEPDIFQNLDTSLEYNQPSSIPINYVIHQNSPSIF